MKYLACMAAFWILAAGAEEVTAPWSDGFETGKLKSYSHWNSRGVSIEKMDGGHILSVGKLPENAKSKRADIVMKRVPVKDSVKYRLSFRAKIDGPDTVEDNPQLEYLFYEYDKAAKGKPLSGWRLEFYDKNGKRIARSFSLFWNVVFRGAWNRYEEIFYPPPGAVAFSVIFTNNANPDNVMLVDDLKLETAEEGTLNINPEFNCGKYNFSGYNYVKNVKIVEYAKGKFALDNRNGWCIMDPVPVTPGVEYEISATIHSQEKTGRLYVWCCDGRLKKVSQLKQVLRVAPPKEETKTIRFIVPEGISYVRLATGSGGVFKSVRMNQVKK